MTDADLEAFVGRVGQPMVAPDPINPVMVHHWCQVFGNRNKAYSDTAFAARSRFGQIVAPPAMTQVWTMAPYGQSPPDDAVAELYGRLDALGYSAIVATNSRQTYLSPQHLGDSLRATKRIVSISPEKTTRLGVGRFITTEVDVVDNNDRTVATQELRHLKFRPQVPGTPMARPRPVARRPTPAVTDDTAFYFAGARAGKLLVQRCNECGALQHPPLPSCSTCQSLSLEPVRLSGRGELYSFTVVHRPVIEPFEAPYLVGLVALDEGPRVVAGLLGVRPDEACVGMRLQAEFADFDGELTLPVFRPATSRDEDGEACEYRTLPPSEIREGMAIPELVMPVTHTFITAAALATRDFQPVHHDTSYAVARGMPDVITNIWTSQGLISRFITDWTGPEAKLTDVALRLGTSNYPGDLLTVSGQVADVSEGAEEGEVLVTAEITGANGRGMHVSGSVTVSLLGSASSPQASNGGIVR